MSVSRHFKQLDYAIQDLDTINFLIDNIKEYQGLDKQSYNLINYNNQVSNVLSALPSLEAYSPYIYSYEEMVEVLDSSKQTIWDKIRKIWETIKRVVKDFIIKIVSKFDKTKIIINQAFSSAKNSKKDTVTLKEGFSLKTMTTICAGVKESFLLINGNLKLDKLKGQMQAFDSSSTINHELKLDTIKRENDVKISKKELSLFKDELITLIDKSNYLNHTLSERIALLDKVLSPKPPMFIQSQVKDNRTLYEQMLANFRSNYEYIAKICNEIIYAKVIAYFVYLCKAFISNTPDNDETTYQPFNTDMLAITA